jgi:hypothetical protein
VADKEQKWKNQVPNAGGKLADPRLLVSALLEESGEVAPVDFGRFGKRAGQIIASSMSTLRAGSGRKGISGG